MNSENAPQPLRANRRILLAAMSGTAVEFYDFFIYGTAAALVFGKLFFSFEASAAQTLAAFMTFGVAFFARPVGAIFFGHFGDRIGRKSTLVATLLLMGISTLLIAFLPTYRTMAHYGIGWVAPALLCLMRFGQGFALGGEWGGAALLAVENAPKGWEGRFVSIMQLGSALGVLFSSGVFLILGLLLSDQDFLDWGWRIPFLLSAALVVIGLWMRTRIEETPEFAAKGSAHSPEKVPLATLMAQHKLSVLAGSAGVIATFTMFYLTTAWALAEGTGPLGYSGQTFLAVQLLANCFYGLAIILAGIASDRIGAGRVMKYGALAAIPVGLLFGPGLHADSLFLTGATLCLTTFALGFVNGPQGAWLASLFPVSIRYSGVALAFNIGGMIGGALSPVAAQWMSGAGLGGYTGLLISLAGTLTFFGVSYRARETYSVKERI